MYYKSYHLQNVKNETVFTRVALAMRGY